MIVINRVPAMPGSNEPDGVAFQLTGGEGRLLKIALTMASNSGSEVLAEPMDFSTADALATQLEDKDVMTRMVPFAMGLHEILTPYVA